MKLDAAAALRARGIQPSAQRVSIAAYVLNTPEHPTAERVWSKVSKSCPVISRATVYNTLNLFVKKGLLRQFVRDDGAAAFDSNTGRHHHFVDEATGRIHDIPWESLSVAEIGSLKGFDVREYRVVMRGRARAAAK